MNRRSKTRRQRSWSSPRRPLGVFRRDKRKRKQFSFEQLESRFVFSAAPLEVQTVGLSNATPEGAEAIWQQELQWALLQSANATIPVDTQAVLYALPNDPYFENQWHLLNTGQETGQPDLEPLYGVAGEDINVVPAWNLGYTGDGVLVGVVDTGVQLFHPDLTNNISPTLRLNPIDGSTNVNPSLISTDGFHGTAVAGIIGAEANNEMGGVGVAPDVTLVPIKLLDQASLDFQGAVADTILWASQNDVDITNNSWGLVGNNGLAGREAIPIDPQIIQQLRNSVIFGRDGLGTIHVFASGNNAGPIFTAQNSRGNYDSASYDALVNSRYTIGVTAVDHDGLYINDDGTFTTYPMAGPSVLVAAPTGSNALINIGDDQGVGSGIWTTDLVGDFGRNAEPLPGGFDPDNDFWPDADYTSRMNGTSAAAPMVSGVIALMLEANPNLTWRDVQEILVRSSRQNAQFESPGSGGLTGPLASQNTWQVNQIQPFRNPDPYDETDPRWQGPVTAMRDPLATPNIEEGQFFDIFYAPDTNDGNRQVGSNYEPQPALFTNGAGYTVSQGYGVYAEQIGYAHGVVDAELAVKMAEQWHMLDQNIDPLTERTYTTSILNPGPNSGWAIAAAEKGTAPPEGISFIVPGGIGSFGGFIEYWNEYFTDDPFSDYDGPSPSARGESYIDVAVPPSEAIDVEWVEVKLEISGPAEDLDFLRIFLTSPDGTQSELNNFYGDPVFTDSFSVQPSSAPAGFIDPIGDIDTDGGTFTWTFSTNRDWGESTNSAAIIDPVTGEPLLAEVTDPFNPLNTFQAPIFRNWELHIENWSDSSYALDTTEVIFHGKPIEGGTYDENYADLGIANAQRVQGFVGIDTNSDGEFNYNRYVQTVIGSHSDVDTIRTDDVIRQLDFNDNNFNGVYDAGDTINQEPFAENIVVQAYRVFDDVPESTPIAQFLTGADGNYYFDFNVQADVDYANSIGATNFEYEIRVVDPEGRQLLDDTTTPADPSAPAGFEYLAHYLETWRITPDWFYAPDRDNALLLGDEPGEIIFDPTTGAPVPFTDNGQLDPIPMAVKNINFLLKQDAPDNQFLVNGTVYADVNGNGKFDGDDAGAPSISVYWDVNRNGNHDPGEVTTITDASGHYSLLVDLTTLPVLPTSDATYQIGVIPPTIEWIPTDPGGDGVETVFAGPGSPPQIVNFFLDPPSDPNSGIGELGSIFGIVFNDLDKDGLRDSGEGGLSGIRVFIDATEDGIWNVDPNTGQMEVSAVTGGNGAYSFADVEAGLIRLDVYIEDEGTPEAAWLLTAPAIGYREEELGPGGTVIGASFGLSNRADSDWDDLPDSYNTTRTSVPVGPSHRVSPSFRLGSNIDGEVNGIPTADATGDDKVGGPDDGVKIISNGGILRPGVNLLQVTVFGFGGVLTGWIDWDKSGSFEADETVVWRDEDGDLLGAEADLVQGTYLLQVTAAPDMVNGPLAARFRWGEPGLTSTGPAMIGEVEGYYFSALTGALTGLAGDYNNDGTVDAADLALWRKYLGTDFGLPNDATPDTSPRVTQADRDVWAAHFGMSVGAGAGAGAGESGQAATASSEPAADVTTLAEDLTSPAQAVTSPAEVASSPVENAPAPAESSVASSAVPVSSSAVEPVAFVDSVAEVDTDSVLADSQAVIDVAANTTTASSLEATNRHHTGATARHGGHRAHDNLLLLDLAMAKLDHRVDDDAPICDRFGHDEPSVGDAELAAVFEGESNWWTA